MWTAFLIGLLLVLTIAGLMAYFPTFNKIVGVISSAGVFLMIVMFGLSMIGEKFLGYVK